MRLDVFNLDLDLLRKAGLRLNGSERDETDVLRACLAFENAGQRQIAIRCNRLRVDNALRHAAKRICTDCKVVTADAILDFASKNTDPISEAPWFPGIQGLVSTDKSELDAMFSDRFEGWNNFRKRYPESHGIVHFSRVGFDRSVAQALLCYGTQFDWHMGHGNYLVLERLNDEWQKIAEVGAWVS